MENTVKRSFIKLFKGLRNLQCQENGAPHTDLNRGPPDYKIEFRCFLEFPLVS